MLFGAIVGAIADWYRMAAYATGCTASEPWYPSTCTAFFEWTLTGRDDPHVWVDRTISGLAYV